MKELEAAKRRQIQRKVIGLSIENKRSMIRKLLSGARQHLRGDFLAVDTSNEKGLNG
jgi:hypothetical protein